MAGFDAWPSASGGGGGFPSSGDAWGGGEGFGGDAFADQAFGGGASGGAGFTSSSGGAFAGPSSFDTAPERSFEGAGASRQGHASASSGDDESKRIARAFGAARSADGFVHAEQGKQQLQKTGLPDDTLRNVWDMSDLDRDGRLSLREFVCAMHLASEVQQGHPLPGHRHQERLVQSVERLVCVGIGLGFDEGAGKPRPEDCSTADTGRHGRLDAFGTTSSAMDVDSHGQRSQELSKEKYETESENMRLQEDNKHCVKVMRQQAGQLQKSQDRIAELEELVRSQTEQVSSWRTRALQAEAVTEADQDSFKEEVDALFAQRKRARLSRSLVAGEQERKERSPSRERALSPMKRKAL